MEPRGGDPNRIVHDPGPKLAFRGAGVLLLTGLLLLLPLGVAGATASASTGGLTPTYPSVPGGIGGWAVNNSRPGSVTAVTFWFVEPTVTCNSSQRDVQDILFAAAIANGDFSEHAAVGVWAVCHVGTTTPALYAVYTQQANVSCDHFSDGCIVSKVVVSAGDRIFGSIQWAPGGTVVTHLADRTSGTSFTVRNTVRGLDPEYALCGSTQQYDIAQYTPVKMACYPTIGGKTLPIGAFHIPNHLSKLVTVNGFGKGRINYISPLSPNGSTFTNTWLTSEPT